MSGTLRIADYTNYNPQEFLTAWNDATGEVYDHDPDENAPCSSNASFVSNIARQAAITLINNCAANAGKFSGHVPHHP